MTSLHAPIYEALKRHANSKPVSFHVPGHQNGQVLHQGDIPYINEEIKNTYASIMEIDVTELSSTDDLHHPEGAIQEAQLLAAATFHAEETFLLVGGSTSGNLALLLTVCDPGDLIIVQRNVHKSIINGLRLSGARAVFVTPQSDESSGLAVIPSMKHIEEALRRYPDAKAVILSNPNYYGIGADLTPYAEVIHRYGLPLLVDEAHGAHYGLHPELPRSAMQAGADAAVQSTHKTLPALTMGAMLHIQGDRINRERLKQVLAVIQSSSPSFPIMASLDISRAMIDSHGASLFDQALNHSRVFRRWLNESDLYLQEATPSTDRNDITLNGEPQELGHRYQYDPLRLVLHDRTGNLSGRQLQKLLEEQGCWAEMSDPTYVVLLIGLGTSHEHIERLKAAIRRIHEIASTTMLKLEARPGLNRTEAAISLKAGTWDRVDDISEPVPFAGGWYRNYTSIRLPMKEAIGRRAAEMVVPYPPGIPLLYVGERITSSAAAELVRLAASGVTFQGASDPRMETIAVFED